MIQHRHVRLGLATLMAAGAGALSGCSFDPYKDDSPEGLKVNLLRAGRMLSEAETKLAVPSGAEAPGGYLPDRANTLQPRKVSNYTIRPARCDALYQGIDVDYVKAWAGTYLTYVNSEKNHLGVGVSSRPGSPGGVARAKALREGCKKFTITKKNKSVRVTAAPLPFPQMGDDSLATRYTLHYPGVARTATYDAVRIVVGHNTVLVDGASVTDSLPIPGELEGAADSVLLNLSR